MKIYIYIIGIIVIIVAGFLVFAQGSQTIVNNEEVKGDVQKITLSYKDYNYYPQIVTVKANQPVRIYLDSSVKGCFRGFVIREFGVNKYLKTPQDYVEFTPKKTGTFTFSCSMGMGTGKIKVE